MKRKPREQRCSRGFCFGFGHCCSLTTVSCSRSPHASIETGHECLCRYLGHVRHNQASPSTLGDPHGIACRSRVAWVASAPLGTTSPGSIRRCALRPQWPLGSQNGYGTLAKSSR
jgi:hypothetical protein